MTGSIRPALAAAALALLAACGTYQSIDKNRRADVGDNMTVQVVGDWAAVSSYAVPLNGASARWTADGLSVNQLLFFDGIQPQTPILKTGKENVDDDLPLYRAGMTESGVMELVESTLAKVTQAPRIRATGLRPETFLDRRGFGFEVEMVTAEQLEVRGLVIGAMIGERLYMVLYQAPRLHFFDLHAPAVKRIANSARLDLES